MRVPIFLDGKGARDVLVGGAGNDIYIVDALDVITEVSGGGTADRVRASADFVLAADDNIEFMETILATATTAIDLTGNALPRRSRENAGANILDGKGARDVLVGGAGNDIYIVDALDVITEVSGGGTADRVRANADFALVADDNIEIMETILATATTAIDLTGNALAQTLTGNAGANILDGKGARDVLVGGAGNDIYIVDALDVITEVNGGGTEDRVRANADFALVADDNIEIMETILATATTAIDLAGNALAQTIIGNAVRTS